MKFYDSLRHAKSASEAINNAQLSTGMGSHIDIENEGMQLEQINNALAV